VSRSNLLAAAQMLHHHNQHMYPAQLHTTTSYNRAAGVIAAMTICYSVNEGIHRSKGQKNTETAVYTHRASIVPLGLLAMCACSLQQNIMVIVNDVQAKNVCTLSRHGQTMTCLMVPYRYSAHGTTTPGPFGRGVRGETQAAPTAKEDNLSASRW